MFAIKRCISVVPFPIIRRGIQLKKHVTPSLHNWVALLPEYADFKSICIEGISRAPFGLTGHEILQAGSAYVIRQKCEACFVKSTKSSVKGKVFRKKALLPSSGTCMRPILLSLLDIFQGILKFLHGLIYFYERNSVSEGDSASFIR